MQLSFLVHIIVVVLLPGTLYACLLSSPILFPLILQASVQMPLPPGSLPQLPPDLG